MFEVIKKDYLRCKLSEHPDEVPSDESPARVSVFRLLTRAALDIGFRAVMLYRIGRWCRRRRFRTGAALSERLIQHLGHSTISTHADIAEGLVIRHVGGIVVGASVTIGKNCTLRQGVTFGGTQWKARADGRHQPLVHADVIIGAGSKILGPVEIGEGALIGANAVVVSDVPARSVVGGIPARVIRREDGTLVSPLEQEGAMGKTLRDLLARIDKLEQRVEEFESHDKSNAGDCVTGK